MFSIDSPRSSSSGAQIPLMKLMNLESQKENERAKEKALQSLEQVTSTQELVDVADEVIQADWLMDIEELDGNMFSLAAFYQLPLQKYWHKRQKIERQEDPDPIMMKRLQRCDVMEQKGWASLIGCVLILLVQISCPPAIFLSYVLDLGLSGEKSWHMSKWQPSIEDWKTNTLSKCMAILFMLMIILNGIFEVLHERHTFLHLDRIFTYFQHNYGYKHQELQGEWFLYVGAMINNWVLLWCCLDAFVVVGPAQCPKDVVMDALGLLFLSHLDDIGGELGFFESDIWPGAQLGWIHDKMINKVRLQKERELDMDIASDVSDDELVHELPFDAMSRFTIYNYKATLVSLYVMLVVLPVFAFMTPFVEISDQKKS